MVLDYNYTSKITNLKKEEEDKNGKERKEEWCGFRPMTMDGLPFIDWSPRLKNVMIAAGHNMIGLSAAPGTGKLVADIMEEASPHINPYPYRIARHHK